MKLAARQRPMMPPRSAFAGFRLPPEVIVVAVRWYLRYNLSYRDVEELLVERGIEVDHVTVFRWVQRFTPLLADAARFSRHSPGDRWFVDETYVKVNGVWRYVYRAIDQYGKVIDVLVSTRRNADAARKFFRRALSTLKVKPIEVVTDDAAVYPAVLDELIPSAQDAVPRGVDRRPDRAVRELAELRVHQAHRDGLVDRQRDVRRNRELDRRVRTVYNGVPEAVLLVGSERGEVPVQAVRQNVVVPVAEHPDKTEKCPSLTSTPGNAVTLAGGHIVSMVEQSVGPLQGRARLAGALNGCVNVAQQRQPWSVGVHAVDPDRRTPRLQIGPVYTRTTRPTPCPGPAGSTRCSPTARRAPC
ncbi:hypothetical protein GCM10023322_83260 [Rugosimonospora acidiphila]|uniref:Integrase catalytic domain-containing protein n=1 Tax=Rugosimonospora acidiphila TaxID=556531 RepID=A0ABP9SSP5_9ACTN